MLQLDYSGANSISESCYSKISNVCLSTTGGEGTNTNSGGNTFSTPNDNIADRVHHNDDRVPVADATVFANSPVPCTYCDEPALNGIQGQEATLCNSCGATICENCHVDYPYSD
jgi:hypothetical protein